MPQNTSPPKIHTLPDNLVTYILSLATESKVSPVEFREKVLIKLLTGNDVTNKISNRVLYQWLNKLKLSATNKNFNALSSAVSLHQDEDAQMIELKNLKITPQIVYVLNKKIKNPDLINTIILRTITFKDEGSRNKLEELLKRFKNVRMVEYDNVDFGDHIFLNSKELTDITIKNSELSRILLTTFKRDVLNKIDPLKRVSFIGNIVDNYFYEDIFYPERINKGNIMERNNLLNTVLLNIHGNRGNDGKMKNYTR
jgi:hypothetical protein